MMTGNGDTNEDFGAHVESYGGFLWWLKTGMIVTAIVTAAVIFLISR